MAARLWRTMSFACLLVLALVCLAGAPAAASTAGAAAQAAESAAARAHARWLSALDAQLQAEMTLAAASAAEAAAQLEVDAETEDAEAEADADAAPEPRGTAGLSAAQEEQMAALLLEPPADAQLAELASSSSARTFNNGPLVAPAPSPRGSALRFKRTMPSRLKFKRMLSDAKDKLHHRALTETGATTRTEVHAATKAKAKAKSSVRSRARAHSRAHSRARAGSDAPDGGEGDWTTAPSWWTPPGDENTRPWKEDDYSYMVRPRDPNSYINPAAAASFAGRAAHPPLLHRALAGVPASVFAHQQPAVPPLPELDANMQPTNNYPNPPFYEHNYHKEYIWG